MDELAVKIENVSKQYRLGAIGGATLQGDLQSWWARVRGKEDPNAKIGSKSYGRNEKFWALDDISFDVKKGEAVGIIGKNGAGKSTLLKLLCRVTAPTKGKIYLNGRITSMLEVGTGFHKELTGRENIYMNGALLGMKRAEITKKLDEIIEFSEVSKFIDTPVKRYSSGMYVKLGFSVAAHLDSEIMIMDEVLAVGDAAFQAKCINKMLDVAKYEGRSVLYVSHNMETIKKLCDKCVVLDHGKKIFEGDVDESVSRYLNVKQINMIIDLSERKRHGSPNLEARFLYSKILNESYNFIQGQSLDFEVGYKCESNIEGLLFRCNVVGSDGRADGVTFGGGFGGAQGEHAVRCSFDTSVLAPGRYSLVFFFYNINSLNTETRIDCVVNSLEFELTADEKHSAFARWQAGWGNVMLPELVTEQLK